jgi:hypothetical protein
MGICSDRPALQIKSKEYYFHFIYSIVIIDEKFDEQESRLTAHDLQLTTQPTDKYLKNSILHPRAKHPVPHSRQLKELNIAKYGQRV